MKRDLPKKSVAAKKSAATKKVVAQKEKGARVRT